MRARKPKVIPKKVRQKLARFDVTGVLATVDS
jgi:hypothetical protein